MPKFMAGVFTAGLAIRVLALVVCVSTAGPLSAVDFRRGDPNLDGFVNAGDGVYSLSVQFLGIDDGVESRSGILTVSTSNPPVL